MLKSSSSPAMSTQAPFIRRWGGLTPSLGAARGTGRQSLQTWLRAASILKTLIRKRFMTSRLNIVTMM